MYEVNNARLGNDTNVDLPLTQLPKRKFTIWLNSWEGDSSITGSLGIEQGEQTFALKYLLPYPLKSRTNFFNISVKSVCLGYQGRNNTKRFQTPGNPENYFYSFNPVNSSFIVNVKNTSAYNGFVNDTGKVIDIQGGGPVFNNGVFTNPPPMISAKAQTNNIFSLIGGLQPIGSFQLLSNGSSESQQVIPSQNVQETAPAGDPSMIDVQPTSCGNVFVPPSYPTKVDDISVCIPDTSLMNNEIQIVFSVQHTLVVSVQTVNGIGGFPDQLTRINTPLLYNTNNRTLGTAEIATFPVPETFIPFNLPYVICLQFEEC